MQNTDDGKEREMVLIIAEKPSLARNIAAGIGQMQKKNGYLEGEGYLITWVFGHLFSLADIETYSPAPEGTRGWTMQNLPCFPKEYQYELRKGDRHVAEQFRLIASLCNRPDVERIVNAGDADREGEIIVRTCVRKALKSPKPFYRLWLPDQTPRTVAAALAEMQEESAYDALANEGYARTFIDWLYGVNLTRYATLMSGQLLRVGRVIVPIVKAIYDRDLSIRNFTPSYYYAIVSKTGEEDAPVVLTSKHEFPIERREEAEALCARYNGLTAVVTDRTSKEDRLPPGKLYSLSTLQNVLGKKYKMSMKDSLDAVQELYERGYLTYPRTNSEYLATAEKGKVRQILSTISEMGYPVRFRDSKYIFDDSKIESHSALTPTYKIPGKNDLDEKLRRVYSTVFRRFVAVFCSEECLVERSELTITLGDDVEVFTLKGTVMKSPGWTKYDDYTKKDKFLPPLNVGDVVETAFAPVEKETTPPRHYTIETLNQYLKNPFREELRESANAEENEERDDTEDYRAIFEGLELGTEATRTGIIDHARTSAYIALNKDVYTILPDGEFLIETLAALGIRMDKYKTSELGRALKKVYHGEWTVRKSVELAEDEIREIFAAAPSITAQRGDIGTEGETMGDCPVCSSPVVRTSQAYECSNPDCSFRLRLTVCKKTMTRSILEQLLKNGRTEPLSGFISKNHKRFTSSLIVKDGKVVFDMDDEEDTAVEGVSCPVCGKTVLRTRFRYACKGKKCPFSVGRIICERPITEEELRALCATGATPVLSGFRSKSGKTFDAALILKDKKTEIGIPDRTGALPPHDTPVEKPRRARGKSTDATPGKVRGKKPTTDEETAAPARTKGKGKTAPVAHTADAAPLCPYCGQKVVRGRENWGCLGYREGCTLRIPFVLDGHRITEAELNALLKGGRTEEITDFISSTGIPYAARIGMKDRRAVVFSARRLDGQ